MRKITLKTTRYYEANGEIQFCVGEAVFADTKEYAGTRQGWSGDWTVTNTKGQTKHFTTEKAIREWLGQEEAAKEMTEAEELMAYIKEHGNSFILPKK